MKLLIISGNPKKDGLCHSLSEAVKNGAIEAGCEAEYLYTDKISKCHVCSGGWGTCREKHQCAFGDDGFNEAQEKVRSADMYCLVTPVYWQESSEHLKAFMDRIRRCEFGQNGAMSSKPFILLASAGGSGNGILQCLEQMQRFVAHTGGTVYEMIGQNRWDGDYKQKAAYEAAKSLASSRQKA